jgi:diaminopimelate epimerase
MWIPSRNVPFSKISGTGNDFVVIDNRNGSVPESEMPHFARRVCRRTLSVGADGVIFVQVHPNLDFAWRFFNSDGSEAEMCGNGSRCVSRFAYERGIAGISQKFLTLAGVVESLITGDNSVKVKLTRAKEYREFTLRLGANEIAGAFLNTGVPHAVVIVDDLEKTDVLGLGRAIRYDVEFGTAGTNADFVQVADRHHLLIRTYERGVENETLACGTGCVASASILGRKGRVDSPVTLTVRSGEKLTVAFSPQDPIGGDLWLEGPVSWIFDGEIRPEAL